MLEIKNISKKFGKKTVLKDVSFTVKDGSVCGLLGLNGAGKSTLMKIICKIVFADSGDAIVSGKSIREADSNKNLGFMIESPAFYKELSGRKNLKLLSTFYPDLLEEDISAALKKAGIVDSADIAVKNYSLGMKQRLYFAFALLNKPKVLILDEPFNGIDPVIIRLFENNIKALAAEGCTILISGHIISELQNICDSVVIIDKGTVRYSGDYSKGDDLTELFLSYVSENGDAQ